MTIISKKPTLGILGIGHLATYTVTGLRHSEDNRRIILSPRNAERSKVLAQQFNCEIADSNQAVIDQSDIILLAVRPFQLNDLLSSLHFPKDKVVISAAAGVSLSQLREKADLPEKLALILPGVSAENAKGFVPIYPNFTEVKALSDSLGKTIEFEKESQFDEAATMACLNGWMYRFFDEQVNWLKAQGIDAVNAREIVLQNTIGSAHYALGRPQHSLLELTSEIAKEGTYTKAGIDHLEANQAFAKWSDALDMIKQKLNSSD
ncbi:MAG: NAD(P)-binding domain-containing protein, partial [Cocleimonas sp.]